MEVSFSYLQVFWKILYIYPVLLMFFTSGFNRIKNVTYLDFFPLHSFIERILYKRIRGGIIILYFGESFWEDCHKQEKKRHEKKHHEKKGHQHFEQHVHEFTGSTRLAELEEDPHNHRFAGVSCIARRTRHSHVHEIITRTDSIDHFHEIRDVTGEAIDVGNGRHVHFDRGTTTIADQHAHRFIFATLIQNPIGTNSRSQ